MNLASEVAQQMDLFLVAAYREEWDICGKTLAALNDLNGQRTILLGDDSNRQVLQFIANAVDCRINRDMADNLPRLRTIQVQALAALREEIGQSGQLSATLMRSLRDTRHLYRSLRDLPPKETGLSPAPGQFDCYVHMTFPISRPACGAWTDESHTPNMRGEPHG